MHQDDGTMARELLDYLTAWLRHHILIQDMAYKAYATSLADAEQPAPCELATLVAGAGPARCADAR